jgi:hypothetical protein
LEFCPRDAPRHLWRHSRRPHLCGGPAGVSGPCPWRQRGQGITRHEDSNRAARVLYTITPSLSAVFSSRLGAAEPLRPEEGWVGPGSAPVGLLRPHRRSGRSSRHRPPAPRRHPSVRRADFSPENLCDLLPRSRLFVSKTNSNSLALLARVLIDLVALQEMSSFHRSSPLGLRCPS